MKRDNKKEFKSRVQSPMFVQCRFEKGRTYKVFYIPKEHAIKGNVCNLLVDKKEEEWIIAEVGQELSIDIVKNLGFAFIYPKFKKERT